MASNNTNASQPRELTEAELDAVSGGGGYDEGPEESITFVYGR